MIWKSVNEKSQSWQAERKRIQDEANRKRSEAARAQHEVSNPRLGEKVKNDISGAATSCGETKRDHKREQETKTSTAKATASKTNRGSVERMDSLVSKRPDLAEKVRAGEMKSAEAIREMNKEGVGVMAVAEREIVTCIEWENFIGQLPPPKGDGLSYGG